MSIIRSNIARQLLAEGGAPRRKGFMFGSGPGSTAEAMSEAAFSPDTFSGFSGDYGGFSSPAGGGESNPPDAVTRGVDNEPSLFQKAKEKFKTFETDSRMNRIGRGVLTTPGAIKSVFGFRDVPPELLATLADDYTQGGLFSEGLVGGDISLSNAASTLKGLEDLGVDLTEDIRPQVADISRSKFAERFGPKTKGGEGGDNEPIKKLRAPITEKIDEEPKLSDIEYLLKFRGSAFEDGGQVRQKFGLGGLGKVFKKAKNVVKKVAKSPVGKVALLAGLNYAPALFGKQTVLQGLGKNQMFRDLILKDASKKFTFGNLSPLSLIGIPTVASYFMTKKDEEEDETLPEVARSDPRFQSLINYYGGPTRFAAEGGDIDEAPMKMASYGYNEAMSDTYQMFLQMKEKDLIPPEMKFDEFLREVVPEMSKKQGIERAEAARGGIMNPNDEMLDLGGNEMDLRGGGFVPLGEYEKKDDVPARLSKNEFVFTADAVRAAGGGSVDRGADLMYKTMKQLENKVA